MALVNVSLGRLLDGTTKGLALLPASKPISSEAMTSAAGSAQGTQIAPDNKGQLFWSVTASGGDVWVKFGINPIASAGGDWLVSDGQTREWTATPLEKIAVVDA
ncbi:hypothetical protein LJR231_001550 [Phyllobacterium sp. LjRoot231]|uniref:hypothetical protein n=1 Tax=Phyllobacterium sp. LjRoot231 TaxID=3342289 RepID=UPI003ECD1A85